MAKQRNIRPAAGRRLDGTSFSGGTSSAGDGAAMAGHPNSVACWPVARWLWVQCPALMTVTPAGGPFVRKSQIAGRGVDQALSHDRAPGAGVHRGRRGPAI